MNLRTKWIHILRQSCGVVCVILSAINEAAAAGTIEQVHDAESERPTQMRNCSVVHKSNQHMDLTTVWMGSLSMQKKFLF